MSWIEQIRRFINHITKTLKNFVRASILSLVVIGVILLLLTQMDQAFTMMVDLIESHWISLLLSFYFINALALSLSHFPIYTYYAADLNDSKDFTTWHEVFPLKFWPFRKYSIYIFSENPSSNYQKDNWANYMRYSIGLLIYAVWIIFIINSFKPNIIFENFPFYWVKLLVFVLQIFPFIIYIYVKERITKLKQTKDTEEHEIPLIVQKTNHDRLELFYKRLGLCYYFIVIATITLLVFTLFVGNFSPGGLILILLTNFAFIYNYLFFRLLRSQLSTVNNLLSRYVPRPIRHFINLSRMLEKSEHYLLLFKVNFWLAVLLIVYSTYASIMGWSLLNGIPIILAFFYFYYYIIASLGKFYYVVSRKKEVYKSKRYKSLWVVGGLLSILLIVTNCVDIETRTHELDLVQNSKSEITEAAFIDSLQVKTDNTLFFIASHGGGLKANVWTLNVLNMLQNDTQGKLLDQSIALSGASGGSLGLALYTGLYKADGLNTQRIQSKIDTLARQNYTSLDLTLTFGLDSYRKLWPFSQRIGLRDRPYYAMLKYQNTIENIKSEKLSVISFRDYWRDAFIKEGYFPSLIMNTAATNGNRGILWSVKQKNFNEVFPYSENLADLSNNKTLPYYQAVSTTNRFPMLSPAAKIPGYGHYIDAGAIDNSGLLGCLDLHNYLLRDQRVLGDKQIAYIEIINSKSLYINYLIEKFKRDKNILHIGKYENESDNIVVDLETGLNLDKIPGYLSDYLTNWEHSSNGQLRYFKIFMPHKVTMEDIIDFLDGEISDKNIEEELVEFLDIENTIILTLTEKPDKTFFDPWEFYEPTLSRHLSKSSLRYIKAILKHPLLIEQFTEIKDLINTQNIDKNENAKISF